MIFLDELRVTNDIIYFCLVPSDPTVSYYEIEIDNTHQDYEYYKRILDIIRGTLNFSGQIKFIMNTGLSEIDCEDEKQQYYNIYNIISAEEVIEINSKSHTISTDLIEQLLILASKEIDDE